MKKILTFFVFLFAGSCLWAQADIAEARTYSQGQTLTITGIVINGGTLGPIRYIQDASAGLPVYDPAITDTWNEGDEVTVTGTMGEFMGLIQITNISAHTVNSTGNPVPTPQVVTPNNIDLTNEGELVQVQDVTFDGGGSVFSTGTYNFTDGNGESSTIFVRSGHPLEGTLVPLTAVNMTGVSSQFNGNAQMLPRDLDDIEIASSFFVSSSPDQDNIATSGFRLFWETNAMGIAHARYGLTPALELGDVSEGGMTLTPELSLNGLVDGTPYYVQPYSVDGSDTAFALVRVYSTKSLSSGSIGVFFNNPIDASVSTGTIADYRTGAEILDTMIALIDNAQTSIEVSVLNNNRVDLVQALTAAHNRGVKVRYLANAGSANTALQPVPPFFVFYVNPDALMHNKFMVVDADDVDNCYVLTGSTNWTDNNIDEDPNNVVLIQDQSLARAFRLEFDEMWGGSNPTPGIFTARFGENKLDDTPHKFIIGNSAVELYFSPSDGTTSKIVEAFLSAQVSLDFAILSFTNNAIGAAVIDRFNNGIPVRGIIESTGDLGAEYPFFISAGVNVINWPTPDQIHHKYGIVDDAIVVTGSHNWSNAAETRNDENTLIIYDADIANQFTQEFTARFLGTSTGLIGVPGFATTEFEVFPNPAIDISTLRIESEENMDAVVRIFNTSGQEVQRQAIQITPGTSDMNLSFQNLINGTYYVAIQMGDRIAGQKIIVQK